MKKVVHILLVFIVAIISLTVLFVVIHNWPDIKDINGNHEPQLKAYIFYSILAISLSATLVYLAYTKTEDALNQSKTNYLLKIDERWSSSEIIKARVVIHDLYLQARMTYENPLLHNEEIKNDVSMKIMDIHGDPKKSKDFVYLLNFIDFLETIGYLHSKEKISSEEVNELLGDSIIYFYEIFENYIIYRRKYKNPDFYKKFESLYLELRKTN